MDRGSYREDRRRSAGRVASSLKGGAKAAARMFFGASPKQKKKLRRTKDRKGVKVDELSVNALDRSKFHAPEKVGESVKLIDIAMGNAPAGPAPGLAPPPPPPVPERPTRRAPKPVPRDPPPRPAPAEADEADEEEDEEDAGDVGVGNGLALLLAVLSLALVAAGPAIVRAARPDLAVAGAAERADETDPWGNAWCPARAAPSGARWSRGPDGKDEGGKGDDLWTTPPSGVDPRLVTLAGWSREVAAVLALAFTWLAMSLGRVRAERRGLVPELGRAALLASGPAALGAALVALACDAAPWPAPSGLKPLGDALREHVAPLAARAGLGPAAAAAAAWAAVAFVLALLARKVLARSEDPEGE